MSTRTLVPGALSHELPLSVLAHAPAPKLSSRYEFIDTREVIERMRSEGYHVASATTAKPRAGLAAYAKHSIDFRHEDAKPINGAIPRLLFINSHDGSSSAQLMAGVFRFVCSNGLVVGDTVANVRLRHSGDAAADLINRVRGLARNTSELYGKIERWSSIDITAERARLFASLATQLRWGDMHLYSPEEVLGVRREEDDAGNLWAVFNRIQENTVRGGLSGVSRSGRAATSRPIADITRDAQYNAALWTLAEEFAS